MVFFFSFYKFFFFDFLLFRERSERDRDLKGKKREKKESLSLMKLLIAQDAACLKHWRFKNLMNLEYVMPVDLQRKK